MAGVVGLAWMDLAELVGQTLRRPTPVPTRKGGTVDPQGLLVPSLIPADDERCIHTVQAWTHSSRLKSRSSYMLETRLIRQYL